MREVTQEDFLNDVKNHKMTVFLDSGLYRHIRFNEPGSSIEAFSLITWPGSLCYTGDMGTFVFQRLADMFAFFTPTEQEKKPGKLFINNGYWASKCEASDKDGIKVYDADLFISEVKLLANEWLEAHPEIDKEFFLEELDCEVISIADEGEHTAMTAAMDFTYDGEKVFTDFLEGDFKSYSYRYLWCCYAIAWGIGQYQRSKIIASNLEQHGLF